MIKRNSNRLLVFILLVLGYFCIDIELTDAQTYDSTVHNEEEVYMAHGARRIISAENPLYIISPSDWGLQDTWTRLPDNFKSHGALLAWGNRDNRSAVYAELDGAERNGIPIVLQLRTFWAVRDERDYPGKVTPLPFLQELLNRYSCIVAVVIAEQAASGFMAEEVAYTQAVIELAAEYGVYTILDESYSHYFGEIMLDQELLELIRANHQWVIPMWELIGEGDLYATLSQIIGLWSSGVVDNWGVNPQTWSWYSAGFKGLDENYGPFFRQTLGTDPQLETISRSQFPLYGQVISLAATAGACVYWIGGESPPHVWALGGYAFSSFWTDTIYPLFTALVDYQLIASREEFSSALRVALVNDCGFPFVWDGGTVHSGGRALRIDNFQNGGPAALAWGSSEFVPVVSGNRCTLSVWVKTESVDSQVYASISWYGAKGWMCDTDTPRAYTPTADWHKVTAKVTVPQGATHATVHLRSSSGYHGSVWFDDASLRDDTQGVELLLNPNMEEAGARKLRPEGWRVSQWRASYEDDKQVFSGILELWDKTYGRTHHAELLPNSGRYFLIPIVPPDTVLPDHVRCTTMTRLLREGTDAVLQTWCQPESRNESEGLALIYPSRFLLSNSSENTDVFRNLHADLDQFSLMSTLGVHSYLLGRKTNTGWLILVENRLGRDTVFIIQADTPMHIRFLKGEGDIKESSQGRLTVNINHQQTKVAVLEITIP